MPHPRKGVIWYESRRVSYKIRNHMYDQSTSSIPRVEGCMGYQFTCVAISFHEAFGRVITHTSGEHVYAYAIVAAIGRVGARRVLQPSVIACLHSVAQPLRIAPPHRRRVPRPSVIARCLRSVAQPLRIAPPHQRRVACRDFVRHPLRSMTKDLGTRPNSSVSSSW